MAALAPWRFIRLVPRRASLFVALFLGALVLYLPRVCRTLTLAGDSAEMVSAAAVWGVPHPPGYALYTLVGHAFSRLPFLPFPFSVHLTSALAHAAAVGLVGCAIDMACGSLAGAVLGATMLALGRVFFLDSLYAEVFPLNDALFALLLWLGLSAAGATRPPASPTREAPWRTMALALGLGLAHHPMMVLGLPALAILLLPALADHVRRRPIRAIELTALTLMPLVAAGVVLHAAASRQPYVSWGDAVDLRSLFDLVTRHDYGGPFKASRSVAGGQLLERLDAFVRATATSFGVGALLAVMGAVAAYRRERRVGLALVLATLLPGPIFAAANAVDIHSVYRIAFFERFFGMSHVPIGILAGIGAGWAWDLLRSRARSLAPARIGWGAIAVMALALPLCDAQELDLSADRLAIDYAHDLVLSTPAGSLLLLKGDMPSQAALYVCAVERRCGDRIVLSPGQLFLPWKRREIARRYPELALPPESETSAVVRRLIDQELGQRPVFVLAELLDGVEAPKAAAPAGLLFRVYPNDESVKADLSTLRDHLRRLENAGRRPGASEVNALPIDEQLVRSYADALRAHVVAARQLEQDAGGEALRAEPHL